MDPDVEERTTFRERREMTWGPEEDGWVAASPNTHLSADTPPALFLYADSDFEGRSEMSEEIAAELRDAGQPNSVTSEVPNSGHVSVWTQIGTPHDETSELIINFMKDNL